MLNSTGLSYPLSSPAVPVSSFHLSFQFSSSRFLYELVPPHTYLASTAPPLHTLTLVLFLARLLVHNLHPLSVYVFLSSHLFISFFIVHCLLTLSFLTPSQQPARSYTSHLVVSGIPLVVLTAIISRHLTSLSLYHFVYYYYYFSPASLSLVFPSHILVPSPVFPLAVPLLTLLSIPQLLTIPLQLQYTSSHHNFSSQAHNSCCRFLS